MDHAYLPKNRRSNHVGERLVRATNYSVSGGKKKIRVENSCFIETYGNGRDECAVTANRLDGKKKNNFVSVKRAHAYAERLFCNKNEIKE
jgi:hypothetical protein